LLKTDFGRRVLVAKNCDLQLGCC